MCISFGSLSSESKLDSRALDKLDSCALDRGCFCVEWTGSGSTSENGGLAPLSPTTCLFVSLFCRPFAVLPWPFLTIKQQTTFGVIKQLSVCGMVNRI